MSFSQVAKPGVRACEEREKAGSSPLKEPECLRGLCLPMCFCWYCLCQHLILAFPAEMEKEKSLSRMRLNAGNHRSYLH